nr:putative glycosyltransferase [Vibrio metoecus]
MRSNPLVSVIIPLFNAEKFFQTTVASVLKQNYKELEVIIVDDCSTDQSYLLALKLSEIDDRIRVLQTSSNSGGPACPRNIGIEASKGEYLAFLDADDIWLENKLSIQMDIMQSNGFNFTSTGQINISEEGEAVSRSSFMRQVRSKFVSKNNLKDLILWKFIAMSSVVVKKEILPNFFNEGRNFVSVEDYYMWLHVLNQPSTRYKYIDENLLYYRLVDSSISNRANMYKHESKALLATCNFIVNNQRYDLYPTIVKSLLFNFVSALRK